MTTQATELRPLSEMSKEEIAALTKEQRQAYEDAYDYDAVDYRAMVQQLAKKGELMKTEFSAADHHNVHMSACLPGECGEIQEIVTNHTLLGQDLDRSALIKDYGDLMFYFEGTRQGYSLTPEEIMDAECHEKVAGLIGVLKDDDFGRIAPLTTPRRLEITTAGLTIAAGEVWDTVKRDGIYRKPVDRPRLIRGMRSLITLLGIAVSDQAWDMELVQLENKRKLAGPFGRYDLALGYQDKSAQDRVDEAV